MTLDRFRGCLLGGAVGDALGAPVEFLTRDGIVRKFGTAGIRDYVPAFGRLGAITDDTQMTLFTAEGLLRAWVRHNLKGIGPVFESVTAGAYLRWLRTQGRRPRDREFAESIDEWMSSGWLVSHRELFALRAPGNTCLSALEAMRSLDERAANNSKGCGGVMRIAPVGLFMHAVGDATEDRARFTFSLGSNLAAITHGHPSGHLPAGALALIVLRLLDEVALPVAITEACEILREHEGYEETTNALLRAERLSRAGLPHEQAIRELGEGWVGEEALAIAVYCALVAPGFEEGVVLAVNHDGDSDSTGSIAGNLLGAIHGERAIPPRWLETLELRAVIGEVATDLMAAPGWKLSEYDPGGETQRCWSRYPGY